MRTKLLFACMFLAIAAFAQQNPIQIDANGLTQTLTAGGVVTRGQIVKINSAGQVVPVATTDTSGAIGVAATSQTSAGNGVAVSIQGTPLVQIDSGGCTAGNIVSISSIGGGSGHCAATASGQQIGVALSISSPGSNFWNVTLSLGSGGGLAANSPLPGATSGPGAVFNVKNYGAFGDSQVASSASVTGTTITCATCNFSTAIDVTTPLKAVFISQPNGSFLSAWTGATIAHIVSVTNATTATTDISANNAITGVMRWGRLDDTAFTTATTAAMTAGKLVFQQNQLGIVNAAAIVYIPAGGYLLCRSLSNSAINLFSSSNLTWAGVFGDGSGSTAIYVGDGSTCNYTNNVPWFIQTSSNITRVELRGFTVDGADNSAGFNSGAVAIGSNIGYVHDVIVERNNPQQQGINAPAFSVSSGGIYGDNIYVVGNGGPFLCLNCVGTIESGVFSNNGGGVAGPNIVIKNVIGSSSGQGFRLGKGVLVDECSGGSACTQVINSQDVWFIGPGLFGTTGQPCLSVDGTSIVHWNGGLCGLFSTDSNVSGPTVAAGGVLEEADVRNISSGTGKSLTCTGTCLNNGSNTSESLFTIASGSESVNTVSLTVTTQGANLNVPCAVGDTALVEGNSVVGYNGKFKFAITAVGTNTVSYTNPTSGLGAAGANGSFSCLNNRSTLVTGVPTQMLAPSQFNCNIPTLTATTTTATTNCFFTPDRDIYVIRFSAGLGTTPATCVTAAVLQVTNGTNSTNLTITNAQAQDDSGAITGVLMKANTLVGVIVQTAASGCGTSPANAAVNFYWMAAIDN